MSKKPTVTTVASGYYGRQALNDNFTSLRDAFDNTLSRDGSTPNAMGADLDMDSNDILNAQTVNTEALRLAGVLVGSSSLTSTGATFFSDDYTGDGSTVNYTMSYDPFIKDNTQVYIDGVYQNKDEYSTSGTTLTFSTAPPLNSSIEIVVARSLTVTGADASNVNYIQGDTDSVNRTVETKLQEYVSIKDFGAVGDDSTDDTDAIQAAIDAIQGTDNVLFIPSGTYKITSQLNVTGLLRIHGANQWSSIIKLYSTTSGEACINADTGQIFLENLQLASDGGKDDGYDLVGLKHVRTTNSSVGYCTQRNLVITGFSGYGIEIRRGIFYKIENVRPYENYYGIYVGRNSFGVDSTTTIIDNAYVSNCYFGIFLDNGAVFTLRNPIFEYCGSASVANSGAMCFNNPNTVEVYFPYWEQNYRNRYMNEARWFETTGFEFAGTVADIIQWSGTAFPSRGHITYNRNAVEFLLRDGTSTAALKTYYSSNTDFEGLGVNQHGQDELLVTNLTGYTEDRTFRSTSGPATEDVFGLAPYAVGDGTYASTNTTEGVMAFGGWGDIGYYHGMSIGGERTQSALSGFRMIWFAQRREGTSLELVEMDNAGNFGPVAARDGVPDLGGASNRWQTVYATTGTINTSDEREKTEITDLSSGLDFVKKLRPVEYKWKIGGYETVETQIGEQEIVVKEAEYDDEGNLVSEEVREMRPVGNVTTEPRAGNRKHYGLIAQDVKKVIDELGSDFAGFTMDDPSDPDSRHGLRYDQFIAPLIKAVQELSEKVDEQAAEIAALKGA